jgi:hypothetical protein
MRVIIAGTRWIPDPKAPKGRRPFDSMEAVVAAIRDSQYHITEIVSGAAPGVDSLGEEYAIDNRIPLRRFPVEDADWKRFGTDAGHRRNVQMARYAGEGPGGGALITVWDGKSRGTADMIAVARQRGLLVFVRCYAVDSTGMVLVKPAIEGPGHRTSGLLG